jgi:hypothetical protein
MQSIFVYIYTPTEDINLIEINTPTDSQLAGVNAPKSQNSNALELPTKTRKWRGTYYDVWKYLKKGSNKR